MRKGRWFRVPARAAFGRLAGTTEMLSRPDLPRAAHAILEAGQLLDADRAARVEAAGGDADLRAEAELAAVGELRRGVVQDDRGIDLAQEFLRSNRILRHDRIGVVRAISLYMRERGSHAVDNLGGDDGVEIFGRPVLLARRLHAPIDRARRLVAAYLAAGVEQHGDERRKVRGRHGAIDQQRLGRTADPGA